MKQKLVTVKQVEGAHRLPEGSLPEITKKIGSKFSRKTGGVLIGLNSEECKYILPQVIRNTNENNALDWASKVDRFYAELTIDVPYGQGHQLDITTERRKVVDSDGVEKERDFPVNPIDYIMWKQCIADHTVATTDHELKHKSNFTFYLEEKDKELNRTLELTSLINKLDKAYLVLVAEKEEGVYKQPDKVDAVLRMLGENPNILDHGGKAAQLGLLRDESKAKLKDGTPLDQLPFYKVVNDPDLGIKSEIMLYVGLGLIEREGSYFREPNSNTMLGSNMEETVMFFKDANNEQMVQAIRFKVKGVEETV